MASAPLPASKQKVGKMTCPTCEYRWTRTAANAEKRECPKCFSDLRLDSSGGKVKPPMRVIPGVTGAPAGRRQPGEASTFKHAPGKAIIKESGVCPKNDGGPHSFKFGACSMCRKKEGVLLKKKGAVANPGGAGGCSKGGKCIFMFAKCKKCGGSELK